MTRPSRKIVPIFVAILFLVVVISPLGSARGAKQQQISQEEVVATSGASSVAINAADIELSENAEDYEVADIEGDPTAPDDTVDSLEENGDPLPTKLYVIPLPVPGGLDHLANGAGTRNAGFGTIRLRGACPGARAVRAFLYWGTIICGNAIPLFQRVTVNGTHVRGRLVGVSPQPNWGSTWFTAYRASIIALIRPGINGDYVITNMPTSVNHGGDPWRCFAPCPQSEGASIVVIYSAADVPRAARVFVNNGAATFSGTININNPLPRPIPPHKALKHTRLGADGQVGGSTDSIRPVTDERTFLGPPGGPFVQIKGPGSLFNIDSDWNGDDGGPLNQLWDTHTDSFGWQFTGYPNILPAGLVRYTVRYVAQGDLICPVAHILGVK